MEALTKIKVEFDPNDISRCESCNLIPLFDLKYDKGIPKISYECQNKHKNELNLSEYIKISKKNSIFNEKCEECKKNNSFFCSNCYKFFCKECSNKHFDDNKHMIFPNVKFDSICNIHANSFSSYCLNCKKNLCCFCIKEHNNHNIKNFSDIIFSDDKIKELSDRINELKNSINKIEEIKSEIIKELDKLKENNINEINFIFNLFKTFEYEVKNNNINYNIIQNVKTFQNKFAKNKYNFVQEISSKSKDYINILKNFKNSKDFKSIKFIKVLKSHTEPVTHIACLQDGRVASCSQDKNLIIYDNINFEPQIIMNNIHSARIFSFIQLEDGKVLTCSEDKTMKIIQLENNNKYSVVQSLNEHQGFVVKAIEFNKNELISISNDNTIKFWNKQNENFICIKSIKFQNEQNYCIGIMKLNAQEFVTVDNGDNKLKFWNYQNYSMIKEYKDRISSNCNPTQLCLLYGDKFIFANSSIYLFDINSKDLIKKFNIYTYSVIQCMDGSIVLNSQKKLIKYNLKNDDLQKMDEINQNNNNEVYALSELNDGIIVLGYGNLIEIWE